MGVATVEPLAQSGAGALAGRRSRHFAGTGMGRALLGTFSHLALDAVMHADVMPRCGRWWPPIPGGSDFPRALHLGCVAAAVLALPCWLVLRLRRRIADGGR